MNKAIKTIIVIALLLNFRSASAQWMQLCESVDKNKTMTGESGFFYMDSLPTRDVTVVINNLGKKFNTPKIDITIYKISSDQSEKYLSGAHWDVNPDSTWSSKKIKIYSDGVIKIRAYNAKGDTIVESNFTFIKGKPLGPDAPIGPFINELLNDFPYGFITYRGVLEEKTDWSTRWESTAKHPLFYRTYQVTNTIFGESSFWFGVVERSQDSVAIFRKYKALSDSLKNYKFDCCSFNVTDSVITEGEDKGILTLFKPEAVNPGKSDKYNNMTMSLTVSHVKIFTNSGDPLNPLADGFMLLLKIE